jgi:pyruvate dehydrogenase E2 component (dihydrolipoamide acetyltransferase)
MLTIDTKVGTPTIVDGNEFKAPAPIAADPKPETPVKTERTEPTGLIPGVGSPAPARHSSSTNGSGKVLATPATRKLARDLGVDVSRVRATGDNGRVTSEDVRAAAGGAALSKLVPEDREPMAIPQVAPRDAEWRHTPTQLGPLTLIQALADDERVPFRGVRKKIAENMARSKQTAAHFTYVDECDMTDLVALRGRAKKRAEERGVKLSFLPFIVKAVVAGLKKYPIINSTLDLEKNEIVLRKRYHIGVAAASEAGLIVPVIKDADKKSVFDIARELGELSEKAKNGKATREELTGSTFTISSLGSLGGLLATPIINFPEVAILGVHKIKPTPVVRDGQIVVREMTNFSISLDHRIVDGYEGALFLQHVIELLTDPSLLFLEMV